MNKKKIHEIRRGMLKVRVLIKHTRKRSQYSLDVLRLFKNGDQWKESRRFSRDDIPLLRLLLDEAHSWILIHQQISDQRTSGNSDRKVHFESRLKRHAARDK